MRSTLSLLAAFPLSLLAAPALEEVIQRSWRAEKLFDESRFEAAVEEYANAVPELTAAFGEAHPRSLIAINKWATAFLQMNRGGDAETILRDGLDRRERAGLGEDGILAAAWTNLGESYLQTGRFKSAGAMHERALALRQRLLPEGDPEVASSMTNLAEAFRRSGELTRARLLFQQAIELWTAPARGRTGAAALPLMPGYARALNSLGLVHDAESRREPARQAFEKALEASARAYGAHHEFTASLHFNLAGHYARYAGWKNAEEHCRQALNVFELLPSFHDRQLAEALQLHADVLEHLGGRKQEAKAQRRRAGAILSLQ